MIHFPKGDQHTLVAMRMIGHQILLFVGDSSSLVKPVEKNGDQYKITFASEFGFLPDSVAPIIDKVMAESLVSKNYVVEFASCDSGLIVHSYMIGENVDLPACRGRPLENDCYELFITLVDDYAEDFVMEEPMVIVHEDEQAGSNFNWLTVFVGVVAILIGFILYLISQKSGRNEDPNVIKIGSSYSISGIWN